MYPGDAERNRKAEIHRMLDAIEQTRAEQ